jgi:hypothetical protein
MIDTELERLVLDLGAENAKYYRFFILLNKSGGSDILFVPKASSGTWASGIVE